MAIGVETERLRQIWERIGTQRQNAIRVSEIQAIAGSDALQLRRRRGEEAGVAPPLLYRGSRLQHRRLVYMKNRIDIRSDHSCVSRGIFSSGESDVVSPHHEGLWVEHRKSFDGALRCSECCRESRDQPHSAREEVDGQVVFLE